MKLISKLMLPLLLITSSAALQNIVVTLPDLNGLSIPEASAALSRIGLTLGEERIIAVDDASSESKNTVIEQFPAVGVAVEQGTSVNIVVARAVNAYVIYDDNDLTLVNLNDDRLDLTQITFEADAASRAAEFRAATWASVLASGQCGQIWSVSRLSSKSIDGCSLVLWLTASSVEQHFWTSAAGVERFDVMQSGVKRAECPAATPDAPLRCNIVFDVPYPDEHISYIYLAYTLDALVVHNQTEDRWMDISETVLRFNDGSDLALSDLELFNDENDRLARLAPGQCLLFAQSSDQESPEPCDIVGRFIVAPSEPFWTQPFRVIGRDEVPRVCEAAGEGQLMICVMVR